MARRSRRVVPGLWVAVAAAALALAWLLGWILVPIDYDDPRHLEAKREYLEGLRAGAERGGGRPNLVLILFDDLGYGDLGCYGSAAVRTPNLDRLAAAGARFTQAYATSPYCSASRAGLLTGRYPARAGLDHVLQAPWTTTDLLLRLGRRNRRLPSDEIILAEALSAAGYATAIFGKWHLGDFSPSLPTERGFDEFYGLLHSNDQGRPAVREGLEVVEDPPIDQSTLTRRYTERAVAFLEAHAGGPFFLYLPHTFPHVPLHVAGDRLGRSPGGLYGDVVEELDWSVGEVVAALERLGLAERTAVVVTSDNGPWFEGSPGGARGRKMDVFEGGMRVPLLAAWPGRIAAGRVIERPAMGIDLFATLLEWAGIAPPPDREIDGRSLVAVLDGEGAAPRQPILYFQLGVLRAVRDGRFKYVARRRILYGNPMNWVWGPMTERGPWLFDLERDPDESYDASRHHPAEAERLARMLAERSRSFAENPRGWL